MKTKKNLVKALKKLVTSFGGEAKSNNTVDLVDEFAAKASNTIKAYLVNGKMETQTTGNWTSDYTIDELVDAFKNGKNVVFDIQTIDERFMGTVSVQWVNMAGQLCAYTYIQSTGIVMCAVKEDGTFVVQDLSLD